ncbi:MAG: hypothetical protein QM778_28285 [Myxococcales bacterium]
MRASLEPRSHGTNKTTFDPQQERAIEYLRREARRRCTADGRPLGFQAFMVGMGHGVQELVPRTPEVFSNLLALAALGGLDHPSVSSLCHYLLGSFRDLHADGLYRFFRSARLSGDTDCTGLAVRAQIELGELDPTDAAGARELKQFTDRLLGCASIASTASADNRVLGVENGELHRRVIKLTPHDHAGADLVGDRGLMHDPVACCHALYPLLAELRAGARRSDVLVRLREQWMDEPGPRLGLTHADSVVAASILHVLRHLSSGAWRQGTSLYAPPELFLYALSELLREFPELDHALVGARSVLQHALLERRHEARRAGAFQVALRANVALNLGLDPEPERRGLRRAQRADGGYSGYKALYTFNTAQASVVYFGSSPVTTAFAIRALSEPRAPLQRGRTGWFDPVARRLGEFLRDCHGSWPAPSHGLAPLAKRKPARDALR